MSQQLQVQTTCPVCELTYSYMACFSLTIGNFDDQPLLNLLRVGKLNLVACLACATPFRLQIPIILNAPQDESLAIYVPQGATLTDEALVQAYMPFYQQFLADQPEEALQDYLAEPYVVDDLATFQLIASADYDSTTERPPITEEQAQRWLADEMLLLGGIQAQTAGALMFEEAFGAEFSLASDPTPTAELEAAAPNDSELSLAEQQTINDRMELLQQLFSLADAAARQQLLVAEQPRVDEIFVELVEVLAEQAAVSEPEKTELLLQIYQEALEFQRASEKPV